MGCKGSRVRIPPPRPVIPRVSSHKLETLFTSSFENSKLPHTLPHTGASATDGIWGRCSMRAHPPARSVTALATNPASPAPSLPHRILNHARAHETAHWLSASDHRLTSCPAAAAPLRWPAKGRSPACGLPAATVSGAPPRQRLRHWLSLSCYRRLASADFWPWRAFARAARRLRRQLRSRLQRLHRGNPVLIAALNSTQPGRGKFAAARRALT